jgi:mono/diheme cytochrome c family protein
VNTLLAPIVATAESAPTEPSNVGLGSVVLTLAIAAFLAWVAYIILNSRRRTRSPERPPPNQEFFLDNDGLENDRLTRVLTSAVVAAGVLAIVMPIYFANEFNRQASATEAVAEQNVAAGQEWWIKFGCTGCHGPNGGGGAAAITEERSGITVNWTVPSLNDVFYRYDEDEVRHWIVYGRKGTPMPANGLEGGGAMTVQEVDQVIAFIRSIQLPQDEAVAKVDNIVQAALDRIANAETTIEARLVVENARLDDVRDGPAQFAAIADLPDDIDNLLSGAGTCTTKSAALVGTTCSAPGTDTDRDGLTDDAEAGLNAIAQTAYDTITTRAVDPETNAVSITHDDGFDVTFDPATGYSMSDSSGPIADLDAAAALIQHLDAAHLQLSLLSEKNDVFSGTIEEGIAFLEDSLAARRWEVDFDQVAGDTGLSRADAERAVGLFNGYCARCHTAGYNAGVAFEQPAGSGAWAPSLRDGRAVVQFPNEADHIQFVINGAKAAETYGVNGLSGVGGMPAFGELLSEADIELIVKYERSL